MYRLLCYNYVGVSSVQRSDAGCFAFPRENMATGVLGCASVEKSAVGVPYAIKSPFGILGAHREC